MERRQAEMFRDLERGHFVALGPALSRRPVPVRIGAVATSARSGSFKLMPLPEQPAEDARDLIFKAGQDEPARPAPAPRRPVAPPSPGTDRTRPSASTSMFINTPLGPTNPRTVKLRRAAGR